MFGDRPLRAVQPRVDGLSCGRGGVTHLPQHEVWNQLLWADVLLPVSPFSETSGTFVNCEGRAQSFNGTVKPLLETRPAWKVLRVLANLLDVPGVSFETSQDVLARATAKPLVASNATRAAINLTAAVGTPAVAAIYQLDGIVRRAPSLQLTADARQEVTA